MSKPKILLLDIETLPNICFAFDLYSYKNPAMLLQEKAIITFAYKWLGDAEAHVIVADGPYDDKSLCEKILKILGEADYVVGHYGDKFDMRFIRSRVLYHGLPPVPPITSLDTYKLAKKYFHLNANRLGYIGKYLNLGAKNETTFKLWADCAKGKQEAIDEMAAYNKQDVVLLEQVFLAMLPYIESKLNYNLCASDDTVHCDNCGSAHVQKRGFVFTKLARRQRYQCKDCGSWFSRRMKKDD